MRPKLYPVLQMCIENGISLGYSRAFKHDDQPSEEVIKIHIYEAIIVEIHEWFELQADSLEGI